MQAPILTDTEAETTVELEGSFDPKGPQTTYASRSIFDIELHDLDDKESHAVKSYEERLREEIKQWGAIWRETAQQLKEYKKKPHEIIDTSILSADKRAYLEDAPDLQRFLRESIDFRQKAHTFLEKDYEEFKDVQAKLMEVCEHHIFIVGENRIKENLTNK